MKSYYGRIDTRNMPDEKLIRAWKREARECYVSTSNVSYERFELDYTWNKVADWQERQRKKTLERVV